jgi:DNA-binding PadR family transcriptional regulator
MDETDDALRTMVEAGFMEQEGDGDQARYRLTPAGRAYAETLIATKPAMANLFARMAANASGATAVDEPDRKQ